MFDLKTFRKQILPSQEQIISRWESDLVNVPLVSFICITFTQEGYIEDTLKGFLMQETNFPFEIIIHDDASTDKTVDIISSYAEKYPLLIKLILQKENQYSINPQLPLINVFKASKGRYLAICEGDDFWIDNNKIQKQVLFLDSHSDINICFTNRLAIDSEDVIGFQPFYSESNCIFSVSDVIRNGGSFISTPSILIRKSVCESLPTWFYKAPVGDFYLQFLGALKGGAGYINSVSCIYRVNSAGSWSSGDSNKHILTHRLRTNAIYSVLINSYPTYKRDFFYISSKATFFSLIKLLKKRGVIHSLKLVISYIKFIFLSKKEHPVRKC